MRKEVGGGNCIGVVITTELILGVELIRVLVVDVAVTLGGLITGIGTLGMDVSSKEEVMVGLGIQ